ncbi:MAG: 16S rRNA (cytosine(1402)-N(4))-methyltransferase RsmH [Candidatus Curtissbacteria bacterium]|nr:16S rRNA (cytosine(1402)-N(4))-methyltransferase RsmH [Candidatus Curtissbacteria bacterium]
MIYHAPVLLHACLDFIDPKPGDLIIDATIGGGGHTEEILKKGAKVLGIDRDPDAIEHIKRELEIAENLRLAKGNFSDLGQIARENGFDKVDGIIFDLGVSSHQLDEPSRGFSFRRDGPLDMRMDPSLTLRAKDIINNFPERKLDEIFKTYGQEKFSRAIAHAACISRQIKPVETTGELAEIIREVYVKRHVREKIDPATRTFQALRIVVNSELLNLEESLPQTEELLKIGGRLVIISFHSLEDGIVKRFFKQSRSFMVLTKKPIGPQDEEMRANPRSRSAKLRAAEKV